MQFGVGITGHIWTNCLNILEYFGHFRVILVFVLAIFCHFRSGNLVLVFLASFGPFALTFQTIFGHVGLFLAIFGRLLNAQNLVWVVFVFGWYLCLGGVASLGFNYNVVHLFPCNHMIISTTRAHCDRNDNLRQIAKLRFESSLAILVTNPSILA